MSEHSRLYAIHSDEECERLELQARLANIQGHLRHLPIAPNARVLDAGCGSGRDLAAHRALVSAHRDRRR